MSEGVLLAYCWVASFNYYELISYRSVRYFKFEIEEGMLPCNPFPIQEIWVTMTDVDVVAQPTPPFEQHKLELLLNPAILLADGLNFCQICSTQQQSIAA